MGHVSFREGTFVGWQPEIRKKVTSWGEGSWNPMIWVFSTNPGGCLGLLNHQQFQWILLCFHLLDFFLGRNTRWAPRIVVNGFWKTHVSFRRWMCCRIPVGFTQEFPKTWPFVFFWWVDFFVDSHKPLSADTYYQSVYDRRKSFLQHVPLILLISTPERRITLPKGLPKNCHLKKKHTQQREPDHLPTNFVQGKPYGIH